MNRNESCYIKQKSGKLSLAKFIQEYDWPENDHAVRVVYLGKENMMKKSEIYSEAEKHQFVVDCFKDDFHRLFTAVLEGVSTKAEAAREAGYRYGKTLRLWKRAAKLGIEFKLTNKNDLTPKN